MKNFNYRNASDIKSALAILSEEKENAYLVAGGTNVMVDIRAGKRNNLTLVNIRGISNLRGVKYSRGKVVIGALTTIDDLGHSPIIEKYAPALYTAANNFADPTTRHTATIGGNIANASPAADTATPLVALQATVLVEKKGGKRKIAIDDFFKGVGKTALASDEMIIAVEFPAQPRSAFRKLGLRNAMAISIVTAAATIEKDRSGVVKNCTIALGSVAPTPVRAKNAEKAVIGKKLNDSTYQAMAEALQKDISPIDDIRASAAYRREVAPVIVKRVLAHAYSNHHEGRGE